MSHRQSNKVERFCIAMVLTIAVLLLAVICWDAYVQLFILNRIENFVQDMLILVLVAFGVRIIYSEGKGRKS